MNRGESRGLGRDKPHVQMAQGRWCAFNIVREPPLFGRRLILGIERFGRVTYSHESWLEALARFYAS